MPDLFELADPEPVEPEDVNDFDCSCPNPDDQYLLEIDNGSVSLVHKACGKQPYDDYVDLVELPQIPVTVKSVPYGNCDGGAWHGEYRCDCGNYLDVAVNHLAVMHNDQPYLIGRDYADRDGEVWRISDLRDAQDQPLVYLLPEGAGEPGPLAEIDEAYGPLTLQPLTPKETTA